MDGGYICLKDKASKSSHAEEICLPVQNLAGRPGKPGICYGALERVAQATPVVTCHSERSTPLS